MATNFPNNIDSFTNPNAANNLDDVGVVHSEQHANVNDAITAIEIALGTNPGAPYASVSGHLTGLDSATASLVSKDTALGSGTASLQTQVTGLQSGTGTLVTSIGATNNAKVPYSGASANIDFGVNSISGKTVVGALIDIFGTNISLSGWNGSDILLFKSNADGSGTTILSMNRNNSGLSAAGSITASSFIGDGSKLTGITGTGSGGGVPYDGATAGLNLATFGLTAFTISGGGEIAGPINITYPSNLIFQDGVRGLWVEENSGALRLYEIAGNIVRLDTLNNWSVTGSITTPSSVSASTMSAGNIRVAKLWFTDGTSQITAGGAGGGVPYTGALSGVNLASQSLTANSISSIGITTNSLYNVPQTLADAANIATNAALGNLFRVTIAANRTLQNPTNSVDGQKVIWEVHQDGVGSHTLGFDAKFKFGTSITGFTSSTASNAIDYIGAIYNLSNDKWNVVSIVNGY